MGNLAVSMKQRAGERASRMKALGVETMRDNSGMARDVLDLVIDQYAAGVDFNDCLESVRDQLTAKALERYGDSIRAALRRAGFEIGDGETLDVNTIADLVREKTGLDFVSLDRAAVVDYVDKQMAAKLSEMTGIQISTVTDGQALKEQMKEGVRQAILSDTAEKLLMHGLSAAAKKVVTWRRYGYTTKESRRKVMQRLYSKRYAEKHRQVWY